jgi:hypothetical protein
MNASQGYLIETNNMHGQAMESLVFDENGTQLSGVHYHYKTRAPGELDNEVDVIQADGSVKKSLLGVHYSLAGDARESVSKTISGGAAVNLDGYIAGTIPVTIPTIWPDLERGEERFRSMSFTKLVHKFGVLERVEAYDLGSTISTDNLAYDAETGEVLLTRTYNEFEDPIYNLKLPAHFAYKGMQGAYQNTGFETTGTITKGICSLNSTTAASRFFLPGDEVLLNGATKAWVLNVQPATNRLYLIDIDGMMTTVSGLTNVKIVRSGFQNLPATAVGTITSKENPVQGNRLTLNTQAKVLHAEAVEYSDQWQSFCGPPNFDAESNCFGKRQVNPFVWNVRGEWRPLRSWLYLTERDRKALPASSSSTNIRDNGAYKNFGSFWELPVNNNPLWVRNETNWTWSAMTTQINPNGTELESQNRLGLYSAEILGFYNQLITGVASNSRYRQMAFEGFEDFAYNDSLTASLNCAPPRHFGEGWAANATREAFHTGNYALKLANKAAAITRYEIRENCPPLKPGEIPVQERARIPFILKECECIQTFSPDPGKYVLTAWVKEGEGLGKRTFDNHRIRVLTSSGAVANWMAQGPIIDGWQRIEGTFDINPGDAFIEVELSALDKLPPVYFDDIRIFPFNGSMKNYVYDDISLKLLAELDANGYAKFYEYNPAGELIRVKQETENGIMTIQESNYSPPKN